MTNITRSSLLALVGVVLILSVLCESRAEAQAVTGVPTGGYVTFNLAPGQSSAPITPPADVPLLVMGSTTTLNIRGVGQVVMERQAGQFLQWVGLNSNPQSSIAESYSGASGTQIVQIDYSGNVWLTVAGPDTFVVTNNSTTTPATGYVSWTYYSNSTAGNTILGNNALAANTTGSQNTAVGAEALLTNTTGDNNTAVGTGALYSNIGGSENTAGGVGTLQYNTSGADNTGFGYSSLFRNTTGIGNTAVGWNTLEDNTTGSFNTGLGYYAFATNTAGTYTTAVGAFSLSANTTGGYDTGFGAYSLPANTTGTANTAFGYAGLRSNTTGNSNIGFGYQSLYLNQTGSNNVAMGYQSAYNVTNGSNNIEIANVGAAADENLIRIGTAGVHKATYIAGIYGAAVTGGEAVYVSSSGELGYQPSASRFKTDVETMPELTAQIQQLHPVTFHYKTDPKKVLQFGLIAEEVDRVYPELVIRDDSGNVQGVRYEELAPMLLSVVQRQQGTLQTQQATMNSLAAENAAQSAELRDLRQQVVAQAEQLKATQGQVAKLNALQTELQTMLEKVRDKAQLVAKQ